ncbi:MAG: universal stress protein [Candidatus Lambdaproteobacteria bacterium]|nr:universal stress protein [Candidatus Lambdaproteobacteria bacterium]
MLNRILVPLDTSAYTPVATRYAVEIARIARTDRRGHATITGMGIVDTEQLPTGRFASLVPREEILKKARETSERLVQAFRAQAIEQGMDAASVETVIEDGPPFRKIIHLSVFCDLVVMGQVFSFPPVTRDYVTLSQLYHASSRPVLITGPEYRTIDRVLLVMDGSAPASRMMYTFAHLNPFPRAQVVLMYSTTEEHRYNLAGFFEKVRAYLESYRIRVEPLLVKGRVDEALEDYVRREKVPLIARGLPPEQLLDRLRDNLRVGYTPIEELLEESGACLYIVH